MKKKSTLLVLFLLVMSAHAQKKWTLQECIDYALANNITLQQNKITSAQRGLDVEASKAALFPNVNFNTNQSVSYRPFSETTTSLTNGSMTSTSSAVNYNGNYGVSAAWTIWNGILCLASSWQAWCCFSLSADGGCLCLWLSQYHYL